MLGHLDILVGFPTNMSENIVLPASPGQHKIWVDLAKEVLSSRMSPYKTSGCGAVLRRLLLQQGILYFRSHHTNVFRQDVYKHLEKVNLMTLSPY